MSAFSDFVHTLPQPERDRVITAYLQGAKRVPSDDGEERYEVDVDEAEAQALDALFKTK